MSNKSRRLYIGITSQLEWRVAQHKHKLLSGFTSRYCFDMLVHFEMFSSPSTAIDREKELKGWRRSKKLDLILRHNPDWYDLSQDWDDPYEVGLAIERKWQARRKALQSVNEAEQVPRLADSE